MEAARGSMAVLLIEDEALIRMLLESELAELGHRIAAKASNLASGLTLAKEADYQLAILDINLNGRPSFPIADAVRARGKALLFVTGYESSGLTADYKGAVVLQKPFTPAQLSEAISSTLAEPIEGTYPGAYA